MRYTDRSRFIEMQRCPRARYLGYEYNGLGLSPVRASVPLTTGLCVHEGLAHLLPHSEDVEGAVEVALWRYGSIAAQRGLPVDGGGDAEFSRREQQALTEALIRAYAARQLPRLLGHFHVREVEQEDESPLGLVQIRDERESLIWMARADAFLQERETGDFYVLSFKTAASYSSRTEAEAGHGVQGLSEIATVEGRFAEWAARIETDDTAGIPDWFRAAYEANGHIAPRIMGVRMEYLLKGDRREDRACLGRWFTNSPLIRAWRRPDIRPGGSGYEYRWRYEWKEEDSNTGAVRARRLGPNWEAFNVWEADEIGGVKGWIGRLASGQVQPEAGDCLARQFVVPVPYFRNQTEIEDWFEQAFFQEARVAKASAAVQDASSNDERRFFLNRYFPQHRRSCDWPTACPYQAICFGSDQTAADPIGSGLYTWREPHHEAERELVQLRAAA